MAKLVIVGVASYGLSAMQKKLLSSCRLLAGSKRLLALVADLNIETMAITPMADAIPAIGKAMQNNKVGVLASGDPLFFGIGRRLLDEFGSEQVEIHPALSSMQEAMARFKLPWDDARLVSLHGRTDRHIPGLLLSHPKIFIFTDRANSPDALARELIDYLQLIEEDSLMDNYRIMVAENLGSEEEGLFVGSLSETADRGFADLNVLCLLGSEKMEKWRFGLTENELHHSRGLITKDEVRAVTLHCLRLPTKGVFWDVGAGSGGVSIEAARLNPELTIYAIERKEEELANIKANIRCHGCYNVVPVAGLAPDILQGLPDPQRVFIGGNGGQLAGIIHEAANRLPEDGRLVANGVIEKTITRTPKLMAEAGLTTQISTILVTRTKQAEEPVILNQISIITGEKVRKALPSK